MRSNAGNHFFKFPKSALAAGDGETFPRSSCYYFWMVAIRFKVPQQRADGFMLLARNGSVRTLKNEIYVCNEKALQALDQHNILYEKVPLPVGLSGIDALPVSSRPKKPSGPN